MSAIHLLPLVACFFQSRGLGKLGRQGVICWLKKNYPGDLVQLIFFLEHYFFVCQDRKLKFSASV